MDTPEIRFYLLICSENLEPEQISARLGLAPTKSNRQGEVWNKKMGKTFPYHCWELSSPNERSWDLNDEVSYVYRKVLPARDALFALLKEPGIEAHFNSVIWMYGGRTPAMGLTKEVVEFAGSLGIDFDFDMYIGDKER